MSKTKDASKHILNIKDNYIIFNLEDLSNKTFAVAVDDIKSLSLVPNVSYTGTYNIGTLHPYESYTKKYYFSYQIILTRNATIRDEHFHKLSYNFTQPLVNENGDIAFYVDYDTFMELSKALLNFRLSNGNNEDNKANVG